MPSDIPRSFFFGQFEMLDMIFAQALSQMPHPNTIWYYWQT